MRRFHPPVIRYAVKAIVPLLPLHEPPQSRYNRRKPHDTLLVELDPYHAPTSKEIARYL